MSQGLRTCAHPLCEVASHGPHRRFRGVASFVRIDLDAGSSAFVRKRFWWHEDPSAIEEQLARLCAGFARQVKTIRVWRSYAAQEARVGAYLPGFYLWQG